MTTTTPPSASSALVPISCSPEGIASLLNEMALTRSRLSKTSHGNARRVYPYWRMCQNCGGLFPCFTKE